MAAETTTYRGYLSQADTYLAGIEVTPLIGTFECTECEFVTTHGLHIY